MDTHTQKKENLRKKTCECYVIINSDILNLICVWILAFKSKHLLYATDSPKPRWFDVGAQFKISKGTVLT